ncbi:MAG: hypothetical protein ACI4XF_09880, partial [Oscillospiraceae bacterium]
CTADIQTKEVRKMNEHDKDSYDVTTDMMLTVKEKLNDISVRFKLWKINPLLAGAVVIVIVVAAVIIAVSSINSRPEFSSPCESGFENRYVTKKKDGITVSMRVSDIRLYDRDTKTSYSTLEYESDSDDMLVVSDIILTNNGNEDFAFDDRTGIHLGYAKDIELKPEGGNDAYISYGKLYSGESGEYEYHYSVTIAPGETQELRFGFVYPADLMNRIDTLYFCDAWENDYDEETVYDVLNMGKPYLTFHLSNRKLFPRLTKA